MSQNHNYAYLRNVPIKGQHMTAGANAWTACRIVGEISEVPSYRINLEDEDEDKHLVGEFHDDKETKVSFTIGIPEGFTIPEKNSVVVVNCGTAPGSRFNGNWQLDEVGPTFKPGDRAEVKITLRKNEFLTLAA